MADLLNTLGPALVGIAGSVIAALVGYRIWRRQQSQTRVAAYAAEKQRVYTVAWEKLEDVHLYVRGRELDRDYLNTLIRDANTHLLKCAMYMEPTDYQRVNRYLDALSRLGGALAAAKMAGTDEEWEERLYTTGIIPDDIVRRAGSVGIEFEHVLREREELLSHFRHVLT